MKNVEEFRKNFPILAEKKGGKTPIYFDNACSSLRPIQVIDAMNDYYEKYPACGGRSMHQFGETVTRKVEEARETVAKFIGAKRKEEIIFTRNTTEGINLVANSLDFSAGDVVLTSDKEHNSNLVPWQIAVKKRGIVHKIVRSNSDNTFNLEAYKKLLSTEKVKLVSVVWTSNLDGVTFPVKEIIKVAHERGALVLLDSAQSAPHEKIDVAKLDVDFLAFSGHKMLGPSGMGILYGKFALLEKLSPFMVGGDTVESSTYDGHIMLPPPEKFEAGLQNYAGIIGLGEAVKYLERVGFEAIRAQERLLNEFITAELLKIPKLHIIGPAPAADRGGIISFYIDDVDSHQIALILNQTYNISIRSGQHCVHSWFSAHNIQSSARASLYFYNTMEEAKIFVEGVRKIAELF